MSHFTSRWRGLARAAAHARALDPAYPPSAERMRTIARQGLSAMRAPEDAGFREWRSLGLAAMLAVSTGLGLWWSDAPVTTGTRQLMQDLAELPTHVPRSPHVPSPAVLLADFTSNTPWSGLLASPSLAQPPVQEIQP